VLLGCLLFDMKLTSFSFTAVCGPQQIKANKPRSIIYAVIVHEVYFALSWSGPPSEPSASSARRAAPFAYCAGEAGCPISTSGTLGL